MHKYDYSFLENFPLPENLKGLLACLKGMQEKYEREAREPRQKVKSEPPAALPEHLLAAYEASGAEPLLLVPCAVLDMLCSLPEGEGSMHAAIELALGLLCQSGYTMCRYFPLEEMIYRYLYFYRRAFDRAKSHWEQNGSEYLFYIEMFLSLLYLCGQDKPKAPAAPRRSTKRAAIETLVLGSEVPISKAEICAALPDVSPTTVEAALGAMVRSGSVRKVGAARAARYIRA
ncbi:MAG: hypothetical protein HFE91_10340 [Acutalibacter sp.]|jgi:hypothetical protein|uniref:hypothetical protein n=1 Tax=Acutalibacter sp. TaxID=1918636 RepID=UPI00216CA600|nr:hypothetical protein [Acutalibacter sp.]MCI9225850.1 hypothetical protein [Acutalibacter sp.]